ncbi:hypothetical protein [Chryseobacterium indoltheticum]|uniref:hypothetical protein n=1 Tax=Chryseobacterium indoltheticum TaxID=254 RepID=UPI003F4991FD
MCTVFIPVGFMQGPAGVFYRRFAFTLVIANFNFCGECIDIKSCFMCFIIK